MVGTGSGVACPKCRCWGFEPAALDTEPFPLCPPGPILAETAARSSASGWRESSATSAISCAARAGSAAPEAVGKVGLERDGRHRVAGASRASREQFGERAVAHPKCTSENPYEALLAERAVRAVKPTHLRPRKRATTGFSMAVRRL